MSLKIGKQNGHKSVVLRGDAPVATIIAHRNGGAVTYQMRGDRKQHHVSSVKIALRQIEDRLV